MGGCQSRDGIEKEETTEEQRAPQQLKSKLNGELEDNQDSKYSDFENDENIQDQKEIEAQAQLDKQQLIEKQESELINLKQSETFQNLPQEKQEQQVEEIKEKHESQINQFAQDTAEKIKINSEKQHKLLHKKQLSERSAHDKKLPKRLTSIKSKYELNDLQNFYFVTCIFSPIQSKVKLETYKRFARICQQHNIKLITVEFTHQGCPFVATEQFFEPYHIQIRVQDPLSLKYNLINTILDKLPEDWSWIAVVDYNVLFSDFDWIETCKANLQTTVAQQLFEISKPISVEEILLQENQLPDSPRNNSIQQQGEPKESLAKHIVSYQNEEINLEEIMNCYEHGKAWAFRRDFVDVFGFQDFFVTGYEEMYFVLCMVGQCSEVCHDFFSENVINFIKGYERDYEEKSLQFGYIQDNEIGYIQVSEQEYGIGDSIGLLQLISDNLSKNKEGIFYTNNIEFKQKSEPLQKYLL